MPFLDKRDFLRLLSSAAVAAPTAVIAAKTTQSDAARKILTYDRVIKSRVIRCGYDIWPPIIIQDLNTTKLSGIFYDYMEFIGRNLSLKIEWVSGTTYANYFEELDYGRIDAMCAGVWPIGTAIAAVDFTDPLYYIAINAYVRDGDTRFDPKLSILNNPTFTIADIDGLVPARIAAQDFPNAKTLSLPQTTPASDMLLSVANGKADITFTDALTAGDFVKNNPGKLRQVPLTNPVRIFGNTIAVGKGNEAFLRMLNNATQELQNSGAVDRILDQYEPYPNSFQRIAKPYNLKSAE
jgi:ABC-type amino acid transport substrate-binding protein